MKFEIAWPENDKPMVRRTDHAPMTNDDRNQARELLQKMLRHEVCWNCGSEWSDTTDIEGKLVKVCWVCAKTA